MAERKQVDWEGVERDYSAGLLSLREIGAKYGVDEAYIRRKAKKNDWSRDLSAKIQSKAEKIVRNELVRTEVRTEKAITEKEIVQVNAQALVNVKLKHRTSINRVNNLVDTLFEEIEELSTHKNADNLPVRVDMTKKLMDTLRISIDKERQAFDIKDNTTPIEGAINSLIGAIQGKSINVSSNLADLDDD